MNGEGEYYEEQSTVYDRMVKAEEVMTRFVECSIICLENNRKVKKQIQSCGEKIKNLGERNPSK